MKRTMLVLSIFLLATVILASVQLAEAQQAGRTYRIGFLAFGPPPSGASPSLEALRQRLRELGYVEGQNLILEPRYAKGNIGRLTGLAAELVRLKADIIITSGTGAAWAAQDATKTIPIIIAGASDPVAFGLVDSLARPECDRVFRFARPGNRRKTVGASQGGCSHNLASGRRHGLDQPKRFQAA